MKKFLIISLILALFMPSVLAIPEPYEMLKGNQMIPYGAPWMADNSVMYFGTDKDAYIKFDSATSYLVLSGVAATSLTAGGTVGANNHLTCAAGSSNLDFHLGTGTTQTTTGANTLNGDVTIAGAKTLTTGTGAIALNGDTTIAATKGITKTAGAGNFDFSAGTGTFLTSSGANTLSGDVTIAATKNLTMSGASTLSTGTGAITLSGPVGIASGIDIIAAGGNADIDYALSGGILKTPTGQATINGPVSIASGVDIVAAGGAADLDYALSSGIFRTPSGQGTIKGSLSIDSGKDIVAAGGASDIDYALSSGVFTSPTGTNTLSGNVVVSGSKTFTSGTGAIGLNGDVTVAAGKKVTESTVIHRTNTSATNITITDTDPDFWFCGNSTEPGNQTYTLPTASANTGRILTFVVTTNPGANYVILDGEGAETVAGAAFVDTTDAIGTMYQVICNGAGWNKLGSVGTWAGHL